jgi:catechol 2,3-dioxygenase-like lactoylglutathione lyase family enzyme
MNHINAVVDDFDTSLAHFRDVYGAQLISDMPKDEWHACLIAIGDVIFELFAPHDDLLHARFGPHYVGVEYQTPDVEQAREVVRSRGMRIVRELGPAFHVHPLDAFGVAFEFYHLSFHSVPPPFTYLEMIRPLDYWRDEHPLGLAGLDRYTVAVADLEAATGFFQEFVAGSVVDEEKERPSLVARSVDLRLGNTVVELLAPIGPGPLEREVARRGDGIRSVVFKVRDLEQARSYFAGKGITLRLGDTDYGDTGDRLVIAPADNQGLLFEFSQVN